MGAPIAWFSQMASNIGLRGISVSFEFWRFALNFCDWNIVLSINQTHLLWYKGCSISFFLQSDDFIVDSSERSRFYLFFAFYFSFPSSGKTLKYWLISDLHVLVVDQEKRVWAGFSTFFGYSIVNILVWKKMWTTENFTLGANVMQRYDYISEFP